MRARLFSKTGQLRGLDVRIGAEATIGRDQDNDVTTDITSISSQHALIKYDEERGGYVIEDLGSKNGTEVDGVAVVGKEPLGRLSIVTLAKRYDLVFQDLDKLAERAKEAGVEVTEPPIPVAAPAPAPSRPAEPSAVDKATQVVRQRPPPVAAPAPAGLYLECVGAELAGLRLPLREGENVVGRVPEVELTLDAPTISRRHATVTLRGGRVFVRDEGSRNKTYVGGREVSAEVEVPAGSTLRFGTVEARVAGGGR